MWRSGAMFLGLIAMTGAIVVFSGFDEDRFQDHDALIARLVADFNANKEKYCGGTPEQAHRVPDLDANLVKAWIIQESGGSKDAWEIDPAQVNVPGDWVEGKAEVGLTRPEVRNTGTAEINLKAAIMWLSRKGFGKSAKPARDRPDALFDNWGDAFERYNGRGEYSDTFYWPKIKDRWEHPDRHVPIE